MDVRSVVGVSDSILGAYIEARSSEIARNRQTQESEAELDIDVGLDGTAESAVGSWKSVHRGKNLKEGEEGF